MKQIFLTVCFVLLIITTATSQGEQKHELSVYSTGGFSTIQYTLLNSGKKSSSGGGGAGLGYTFNINPSLGIVTGLEMTTYGAEASFDNVSGDYEAGTGKNLLKFSYALKNYKERQSLTLFSIPVMARYSLPLGGGGSTKFYVSGGFKFGFPVSAKADISSGSATTDGYFADESVTYAILPTHGFASNISLPETESDIELGFSTSISLETGVSFSLTDRIGLYTGLYFDYGLNNIQKVNDKHLLEYDLKHLSEYDVANERPFLYNSVLNSGLTDRINLLSIGLKVRIGFKL
jgi:hypothetical protein